MKQLKIEQQGFTLIELIVVIVILGILAAVALPKFSSLTEDARIAKMNGLLGSIKGAAAMAHGSALGQANTHPGFGAGSTVIGAEDGTLVAMRRYYPDATTSGIAATAGGTDYASNVGPAALPEAEWDFYPDAGRTSCVIRYYAATTLTGVSAVPQYDASAISSPGLCG